MDDDRELASPALRLSDTEAAVFGALGEREANAPNPRLTTTYRRLLELSRSEDPLDGILVAHLVREMLSALPRALGIELARGRMEYEDRIQAMSAAWPADGRAGEPPASSIRELRRLLDDHDVASARARQGPRALLDREDRGRAGYVPESSVDRWVDLSVRGSDLAHRLRSVDRELPAVSESRRLVEELTATLTAAIAPYFIGINELDRLLATEAPTEDDANAVAALLRTSSQYRYFFDRADERWLRPLAGVARLLNRPPGLVDVGGGYVQTPDWPQGRFLARVGAIDPTLVSALLARVPGSTNPRVVAVMIDIAQALPVDHAARLVPTISSRIAVPLAVNYAAIDAAKLAKRLADEGQPEPGARLLTAVTLATIKARRDMSWHLEQVLGDALEAVVVAGGDMGHPLASCVRRVVRNMGRSRRYSTIWLRNIDRRPTFGVDERWIVPNALYRALLAAPAEAARNLTSELLATPTPILVRIALAACADRPELVVTPDPILVAPDRWDDDGTTRAEFRRALGSLWARASQLARDALLEYAARAPGATRIRERLAVDGIEYPEGEVERSWRSRLLYRVREELPGEWVQGFGPLDVIEDDRIPEPWAERIVTPSPVEAADLESRSPDSLLNLLRDWNPPEPRGFRDPTLESLAESAGAAIVSRIPEFETRGAEMARLRPPVVQALTASIERALREGRVENREAAVRLVLEIAENFDATEPGDVTSSRELRRDFAGTIAFAANAEILTDEDIDRALRILQVLFTDEDPSPESEARDAENGYDVGMLALNSVRGEATTAMIDLLLEARRMQLDVLAGETSTALRLQITADQSASVRAAVGIRLPWLLTSDLSHQVEWLEILFGVDAREGARQAVWHAYLTYSRFFIDTANLLAAQYGQAVSTLEPRLEGPGNRRRDEDEQLGVHVALAHLLALPAEAEGDWLHTFYERSADWLRSRVTRWIAEQGAAADASPEVRARARTFLVRRTTAADPASNSEELKAVGWIAGATDFPDEVLDTVVLPALEKSGGASDNEVGVAGLAARMSEQTPRSSARALQLLVAGDPWQSLPHVAAGELRRALQSLIGSTDQEAKAIAEDVVNTLGAQGFLEYRDLLGRNDAPA